MPTFESFLETSVKVAIVVIIAQAACAVATLSQLTYNGADLCTGCFDGDANCTSFHNVGGDGAAALVMASTTCEFFGMALPVFLLDIGGCINCETRGPPRTTSQKLEEWPAFFAGTMPFFFFISAVFQIVMLTSVLQADEATCASECAQSVDPLATCGTAAAGARRWVIASGAVNIVLTALLLRVETVCWWLIAHGCVPCCKGIVEKTRLWRAHCEEKRRERERVGARARLHSARHGYRRASAACTSSTGSGA